MTQHAAALTYYVMLALAPSLVIAAALLGLFGQEGTVADVTRYLARHGAPPAVIEPVRSLLQSSVRAGTDAVSVTLVVSLALSLIGASGAFASVRRALNAVYRADERRAFVGRKLADLGATLLLIVLAALVLVLLFVGGRVADDLARALGLGRGVADAWQVMRWPAALFVTLVAYAFLYREAPDVSPKRWRTFSPGALVAVPLWLLISYGFWWYVKNLGHFSAYGTFGAAVVVLIWLFLSNAALLLGAELNATLTDAEKDAA